MTNIKGVITSEIREVFLNVIPLIIFKSFQIMNSFPVSTFKKVKCFVFNHLIQICYISEEFDAMPLSINFK